MSGKPSATDVGVAEARPHANGPDSESRGVWRIADDIAVGNVFGIFWRIDSGRKFGPRVCVFIDSFDPDSRHGHAEAAEIARRIADALNAE